LEEPFIPNSRRANRKVVSKPATAEVDLLPSNPKNTFLVHSENTQQRHLKEQQDDDLPLESEERKSIKKVKENMMGVYVPSSLGKSGARPRTATSITAPRNVIEPINPKEKLDSNIPPHKEKKVESKKSDVPVKSGYNTINKSGEHIETSQSLIPTNATMNKDLAKELEESKKKIQELRIALEEANKGNYSKNELEEVINTKHNKELKALKVEHTHLLEIEREGWKREKRAMEDLHRLHMNNLERQYKVNMERLKRELEFEGGVAKNQMEREAELAKLTAHVDSLTITIRAKLEEELRKEMREKMCAVEEKLLNVEEAARKNELKEAKMEADKKRMEDMEELYKKREKQMKEEIEECKRLYNYQKEFFDDQYKELLGEIKEKREQLLADKRELETKSFQVEKLKKELEIGLEKERAEIEVQQKVLDKRKQEFEAQIEEEMKAVRERSIELNGKREELIKEQAELLRKQQTWDEREHQLRRDNDELQLKINKLYYEQKQLDIEKERVRDIALQVEEESRAIGSYKTTIEDTKVELEEMKAEIDNKESILRNEKAQLEYNQKDFNLKLASFENTQLQYLRKPILNTSIINSTKPIHIPIQTTSSLRTKVKKSNPLLDSFKASDFIKDMEKNFGTRTNFTDYVASEKNFIRNPRASQERFYNTSSIPRTIIPLTTYKSAQRYGNLIT